MDKSFERKVYWIIGLLVAGVLIYPTKLNPFKEKNPSWQVIKEAVATSVYCTDWDTNDEGDAVYGYAPCVRLTNVTFDTKLGDQYCYSSAVEIGGYQGDSYEDISSWNRYGNKYYCVSWYGKYEPSDVNNPDDWQIKFENESPADLV